MSIDAIRRRFRERFRLPERLHRDEHGTISILTVFAVLLLTMLLGMVMNVGRQVDDKIRMQNAADAAAYSGGVVIARGMNTLTFTNHLLFDVCSLTALLREARDRNAEQYVPDVLAAWQNVAPKFAGSGFDKFDRLSQAIPPKVPMEQDLATAFGEWGEAASELLLPVLEEILRREMIPEFQQAVVWAYPVIAQEAAMQSARRNGPKSRRGEEMLGALWRTSGQLVGGANESSDRSLHVVDPVHDVLFDQATRMSQARKQRKSHAEYYLGIRQHGWYHSGGWHARSWNDQLLWMFDHEAKMARFAPLWRGFSCGYLHELLDQEYPMTNLPLLIGTEKNKILNTNTHLENHFTFLGVVYREKLPQLAPGLFRNPADSDAVAYATVRVFIPQRRLVWHYWHPVPPMRSLGGMPGHPVDLPDDDDDDDDDEEEEGHWYVGRQGHVRSDWTLLNQRWATQLVPTTQPNLAQILQTVPPLPEFAGRQFVLPDLGGLSTQEIGRISTH